MKILTRSRVLDISSTIAALMHTSNELLDEGAAAGINYGLVLLADEIGVLHVVQRMLNTHHGEIKEDEKNETGN